MGDYRQDTVHSLYDAGLDNIVVTSVNEVKARDETIDSLQSQLDEARAQCERLRDNLIKCHNAHSGVYPEQLDVCRAIHDTAALRQQAKEEGE